MTKSAMPGKPSSLRTAPGAPRLSVTAFGDSQLIRKRFGINADTSMKCGHSTTLADSNNNGNIVGQTDLGPGDRGDSLKAPG